MASRDTAQLILEIDAKVATAQRDLNRLARSVQQDAANMGKSLSDVEASGQRMARSLGSISGRTRSGFTQLSFQIGDVSQQMALGVSGARIFAQQSGQVIQALQIMGGEGNKFLSFLGGPWGIAISTAAVILAPLASKLFDTGDEVTKLVDKMKEQAKQAALNREADEAWKNTVEGLTEAIRKRREEQEKQLHTDIQAEQDSLVQARKELSDAQDKQREAAAELTREKAKLKSLQNAPLSAGLNEQDAIKAERDRQARLDAQKKKVDELTGKYLKLITAVSDAEKSLRGAEIPIGQRAVEDALDPVKAATDAYTVALGKLNDRRIAGLITQKEYNTQLAIEKKRLEDVKEAAKDAQKSATALFKSSVIGAEGTGPNKLGSSAAGFGQFMPKTWLSYFNRIFPDKASLSDAAKLEFRDVRAVAVAVIDKATDDYVKVLKAAGQQITAANLYAVHLLGANDAKKLLAASSNTQTSTFLSAQVLKGNPFLNGTAESARAAIAKRIGDSSGAVSSGLAAIDKAIADQKQTELDQDARFLEESNKLNSDLLRAKAELSNDIDEQTRSSQKEVFAAERAANDKFQQEANEGKITQAQADELKAREHTLTVEKLKAIEIDRQVQLLQQQDERQQRVFEYQADDLRFADEMATTQAEHRRLQLEILDVVYQEKEAHLRSLKAQLDLAGKTEEAADVQDQINRLPTEKAHDQVRVANGTMNPLEAWAHQVPKTAAEINEALQSIEVRGIDSLADAITGVIMGTESLGKAFKDIARSIIADIIQMTIKMLIFKAISSFLGGSSPAPAPSAMGNVFSRGKIIPHRLGGVVGSYTVFPMSGGRLGSMGEDGPEAIMPLTRDPSGRLAVRAVGNAANNNQAGPIEVHVVVDASDDLLVKAAVVADQRIRVAEPRIVQRSVGATMRTAGRPTLMGRR